MNITGPLTVGDHVGGAGTVNGQDAYTGQLVVGVYEPKSALEENWAESEVKNALRAEASKSSHAVVSIMGDKTHALTGEGHDASEDGTGRGTPIVVTNDSRPVVTHDITPALKIGTGLDIPSAPAVTYPLDLRNALRDPEKHDEQNRQGVGVGEEGEPAHTVTGAAVHGVATDSTVRRLTPTECERLQGFPDGWTDGQADSARYRQMGNAVAVPVFEWVIGRLVAVANAEALPDTGEGVA